MLRLSYLSIDKDVNFRNSESTGWLAQGVAPVCADSMREGISLATDNIFFFIFINADNINYIPELIILREVTKNPILIGSTDFSAQQQVLALNNGADLFWKFGTPQENMDIILASIGRVNARMKQGSSFQPTFPLIGGDIILSKLYRRVFVKDKEVPLHKKEFEVLHYLMMNNGRVVTHIQLLQAVWGDEFGAYDTEVLWRTINRLRSKLSKISSVGWEIKVERGVGYKFIS